MSNWLNPDQDRRSWSESKLFVNAISRREKSPLAREELMNSLTYAIYQTFKRQI